MLREWEIIKAKVKNPTASVNFKIYCLRKNDLDEAKNKQNKRESLVLELSLESMFTIKKHKKKRKKKPQ
jgi:hypothetical protein